MNTPTKRSHDMERLLGIPDFMVPWLDRFYAPEEIELIRLLDRDKADIEEIEKRWRHKCGATCPENLSAFITRAYKRGIINRNQDFQFEVADFHTRYDIWAVFEGWQDIPVDIRERLNVWELDHYQVDYGPQIDTLKKGKRRDYAKRWPEYILLHEADQLIDKADQIYLWPCNCRSMVGRCKKPVYTCLRFSNNRDIGWEISKSKAREIIGKSNHQGLMQSGEISVDSDGHISGAICNCCKDCCFPHLLAETMQAEKLWPLTRYEARFNKERCTACGRCVRRCPFDAFSMHRPENMSSGKASEAGQKHRLVAFNPHRCRGCGLCSTGCKEAAIAMVKLENRGGQVDGLIG